MTRAVLHGVLEPGAAQAEPGELPVRASPRVRDAVPVQDAPVAAGRVWLPVPDDSAAAV